MSLDLNKGIKYAYDDICVVPAEISRISSRKEINPYTEDGYLPLFTAPMSTVVDCNNFELFENNKINAIIPRNIPFDERKQKIITSMTWVAVSLDEFINLFLVDQVLISNARVLIDIANGHMLKLFEAVRAVKDLYGSSLEIMIGNIANPLTYKEVYRCGADYVRCSIGSGSCCITASNTAVTYPQASLIDEIYKIKKEIYRESNGQLKWKDLPKIIADGGIRNYSDIIKALVLGADYVMIGGLFGKMLESAASKEYSYGEGSKLLNITSSEVEWRNGSFWHNGREVSICSLMYGMASKKGKEDLGLAKGTAEGIEKTVKIEYTMKGWTDNFTDYLRSAMSYTNSKELDDLRHATAVLVSPFAKQAINK